MADDLLDHVKPKFRRLLEARAERDEAKAALSKAEEDFREVEAEIYEWMDESPFEGSVRIDLGQPWGRVLFTPRATPRGRALDKERLRAWAKSQGRLEEFFHDPKVSERKLNEVAREAHDSGGALPPGMDVNTQQYVAVTLPKSS